MPTWGALPLLCKIGLPLLLGGGVWLVIGVVIHITAFETVGCDAEHSVRHELSRWLGRLDDVFLVGSVFAGVLCFAGFILAQVGFWIHSMPPPVP